MPVYMISFDIKNGSDEDYETVHSVIRNMFPIYTNILTTTYMVKTKYSKDPVKVRDTITSSISKSIDVMVTGTSGTSAWLLDKDLSEYLKKVIYK